MNDLETLTSMWKSQESKVNESLRLNREALREIKILKAKSSLRSYTGLNIFVLTIGIAMVNVGAFFAYNNAETIYLLLSGVVFSLWSLMICFSAVAQLKRIVELDFGKPVTEVQSNLRKIQLSALYYFKLSLMIAPFYLAFMLMFAKLFFNIDLVLIGSEAWLNSQFVFSGVMAFVAIGLYKLLAEKNADKPIVRFIMQGCGSQTCEAAEELNQLGQFENAGN